VGVSLVVFAALVYALSNPLRVDFYDHFAWQADAWLHGRFAISYPVTGGPFTNWYYQDVMPVAGRPGEALLPFPPLPAVVLLPFVAVMGLAAPASWIAAIIAAIDAGLAWRLTRRLAADRGVALVAAIFFAFGTVAWYAAAVGSTWFLAHVVALGLSLLAVTLVVDDLPHGRRGSGGLPASAAPSARPATRLRALIRPRHIAAGLLLGLAATSRLTAVFGAPFLFMVGGGSRRARLLSVGAGMAIPLAALAIYNLASSGHLFNPAYGYIASIEDHPVAGFWHPDWNLEDLRYIPQNALIALLWLPQVHPECGAALLNPACGTLRPDPVGMSVLLTSPAYLLLVPAVRRVRVDPLAAAGLLATLAILLADLAHFSQGWVQFGWRFSNDLAPFALVPVTLTMARMGLNRRTLLLVGLSVLINLWGVYWGMVLGW
jgi:hypothetical protein